MTEAWTYIDNTASLGGCLNRSRPGWMARTFNAAKKIQHDLLATFRDDFHKYGGEMEARLLHRILLSVAEQLGNKFVYSQVDPGLQNQAIKKALLLLFQAKVCSRVSHTSANGLPLGAQSNEKFFKALMVDVGLISAQLGLTSLKPPARMNCLGSIKVDWPNNL